MRNARGRVDIWHVPVGRFWGWGASARGGARAAAAGPTHVCALRGTYGVLIPCSQPTHHEGDLVPFLRYGARLLADSDAHAALRMLRHLQAQQGEGWGWGVGGEGSQRWRIRRVIQQKGLLCGQANAAATAPLHLDTKQSNIGRLVCMCSAPVNPGRGVWDPGLRGRETGQGGAGWRRIC